MAEESDGIEEALESTARLSVMAVARLGSEIARAHEDRLREHRRVDEQEVQRLTQRFEIEQALAAAKVGPVRTSDSSNRSGAARTTATPTELDQASEWAKSNDPKAWDVYTCDRMGSDTSDGRRSAEGDLIRSWRKAQAQQSEAAATTAEARRSSQKKAEAAMLLAEANNEAEPPMFDSAERRHADARAMEAHGVEPDVAESRMRADIGRAQPATLATAGAVRGRRSPKARKSRGSQLELPGIER